MGASKFNWGSQFVVMCALACLWNSHRALAVGLPKTSGSYTFELCGGRRKCSKRPEFLGFNNKTCDAGVPPMSQTYGNTVGPLIRQASGDSKLWRWWEVKMTSKISSNGAPMATIKNIFPSNKGKPKCLGHYITDYYHYKNKQACTELPWAERVHMHAESRPWEFQAVPGTDCFNIIDDAKPDGCLKFLSASSSCSEKYVHLAAGDDGSGLQRWRLVGYKGPPPAPPAKSPPRAKSPPPPLRSKSPPPPSAKPTAPLLISVSASSPTTGSVVFQPTAGASSCNVTVSKDGQTVTRAVTSLNYPFTNFYAAGLASDTDYTVKVLCQLPSGATLPAPVDGTLHTPPNSGHPAVINAVPTSGTSGNITIVPPDALVCKAKQYEVKATPKAGGATQTFTSTSLNVALTGLTSGVQYSIIVDAICADGSTTKPSDPIYFTPLKSAQTPSSPPPPLAKPSPPPSPGSKSPPTVKSPPPPPRVLCTNAPIVDVTAVTGNLLSFNVGIPKQVEGTTSSELAYGVGCTYANGTDAGGIDTGNGTWLPATDPNTSFQLHLNAIKEATCEVLVLVRQIGRGDPVLCKGTYGTFTIKDLAITPGILVSVAPTTADEPPTIQIIGPLIKCDNMTYVVATVSGDLSLPFTAAEADQPVQIIGFPPKSQITVQGVCPDGSKTPTSIPVDLPSCATGYSYSNATRLCEPPVPSPPPPVSCTSGQYNNGGVCTTCSSSLPNCAVVAPCTATADSTCTQCAVGWLLKNSTCTKDPCVSAAAGANIQGGNIGYSQFVPFTNPAGVSGGNFPPGTYEVRYVDGCMTYGPYGPGQKWTVSAGIVVGGGAIDWWYGWFVGTQLNEKLARAPGAFGYQSCWTSDVPAGMGCGFDTPQECITYSRNQPSGVAIQVPAIVTLSTAAPLGVWLQDTPNNYADNVASPSGPPSWSVRLQGCTS